jgi:hypothetical protein
MLGQPFLDISSDGKYVDRGALWFAGLLADCD